MKVLSKTDAAFASHALSEIHRRLVVRGQDKHAERLQRVIDALGSDTIHIADGAGQA